MGDVRGKKEFYLNAGRIIESEGVPEPLRGATIIVTSRGDIPKDRRFSFVDATGKRIPNILGRGMFVDESAYERLVEHGFVDLDGVDTDAVREAVASEEGMPVLTCEDMDHVASLEIRRELYHEQQSNHFFWDTDGTAKIVSWKQVAHHLASGELRYEKDDGEKRLKELLRDCELDENRRRSAVEEAGEGRGEERESQGRQGGRLLAFAILVLGIAIGYGLGLFLLR